MQIIVSLSSIFFSIFTVLPFIMHSKNVTAFLPCKDSLIPVPPCIDSCIRAIHGIKNAFSYFGVMCGQCHWNGNRCSFTERADHGMLKLFGHREGTIEGI